MIVESKVVLVVESSKRGQSLKEVAAAENMEKVVDARMSDKRFKKKEGEHTQHS